MSEINHNFRIMSVKTEKKDGTAYKGKDGSQAWRVSTKIGEEWYANIIYDEEFIPKKEQSYNIKLTENEGFLNWEYKLVTKKDQMKAIVHGEDSAFLKPADLMPESAEQGKPKETKDPMVERIVKGMCFNNACTLLANEVSGGMTETNLKEVKETSEILYNEMHEWLTT